MNPKITVAKLTSVPEALLMALYFRARELERPDAMLCDSQAPKLLAQIDYDFSKFDKESSDQSAAIIRVREFDRMTSAFLNAHPQAVVVNIGCGLDTRYNRVDDGEVEWYDLDLPDVIDIRRRLLSDTDRCHMLACSALDTEWMDRLSSGAPGRPFFFMAEGVLPYLPEQEVRELVLALHQRFPHAELAFDAMTSLMVSLHNLRLRHVQLEARLHWGLEDDRGLEAWADGLKLLEAWFYFDHPEPRLGAQHLMRFIPPFARGVRILRYEV